MLIAVHTQAHLWSACKKLSPRIPTFLMAILERLFCESGECPSQKAVAVVIDKWSRVDSEIKVGMGRIKWKGWCTTSCSREDSS
jgi:hypothetical protein